MAHVFVEKIDSFPPADAVAALLERVDMPSPAGKRVLVKPNMGRVAPNQSGVVTTREVICAVAAFFVSRGASVAVGDSPIVGVSSAEAFARAGITPETLPAGAELVDLDAFPPVTVPVPGGELVSSLRVCRPVAEADIVVSVPVMKTHMHTVVSLGLKNMKGCLYRKEKVKFHKLEGGRGEKALDVALADMAGVLLPDLVVVDGSVGMEGFGPSSGRTVRPGLLVAGTDCIAVDAVAAELMGFSPGDVPSLRLCAGRGLGSIETTEMDVSPPDYLKYRVPFEPAPVSIDVEYEGVYLYEAGACSACLSTVFLFLKRHAREMKELYGGEDVHIYIGDKNSVREEGNVLLIGKCTAAAREKGVFIQGCPPVPSDIIERIRREKR